MQLAILTSSILDTGTDDRCARLQISMPGRHHETAKL